MMAGEVVMTDNRSLEKKLLALSRGEEVKFTKEEKQQIGQIDELNTSKEHKNKPKQTDKSR